jgi:hypothetical protein
MRHLLFAGMTALSFASPALADHAGPSGGFGAGGALNVLTPDTLDGGAGSAYVRLTYLRPQQRSEDKLTKLSSQHVHAHNADYNLNGSIGASYGVTHRLTVSAELPYIRRDDLREGEHAHSGGQTTNEVVRLGTVAGVGDASLFAKYKLIDGRLSAALIGGVKMPTGSTHRRSVEGERLETEHQPGTGSWDPILGAASAIHGKSLRITGSAIYEFATKGSQRTRLGDRFQGGIALSHQFGPAEHHHDEVDAPEASIPHDHHEVTHGHASWDAFVAMTAEWEGRQRVAGEIEDASGGTGVWLSPGARFNSARGISAAVAVGVPVWQRIRESHPENSFRTTLSLGFPL